MGLIKWIFKIKLMVISFQFKNVVSSSYVTNEKICIFSDCPPTIKIMKENLFKVITLSDVSDNQPLNSA